MLRSLRALQTYKAFCISPQASYHQTVRHTPDTYNAEVDTSPPSSSTTHQIDGSVSGPSIKRPNEEIRGKSSDIELEDCYRVSQGVDGRPYDLANEGDALNYGGRPKWVDDKAAETSGPGEGPEGSAREGRIPEEKNN